MKLEAESRGSKVEEIIEQINSDLNFKLKQMDKLIQLIDSFKGLNNKILKMKYIDCMTLENIAYELNYSPNYIRNKHAEIIRTLKYVDSIM